MKLVDPSGFTEDLKATSGQDACCCASVGDLWGRDLRELSEFAIDGAGHCIGRGRGQ